MTRGRQTAVAAAVAIASAAAYTWPLLPRFFTHLAGDPGDPYSLLWSIQVFRDELLSGRNPFFTDRAFHPEGVTLVFQTANWPGALFAVPLWSFLPAVSVWNAIVLLEYALAAFAMFLLARELTGDFLASLAVSLVFPLVPYHTAHSPGHIHLIAVGWIPLYLWRLHRALTAPSMGNGALAGLVLGAGTLAAFYHLVFAAILSLGVLFVAWRDGRLRPSRENLAASAALALAFAASAGPLLFALLAQAREPIAGIHDPSVYSLDVEAFFLPNQLSAWRSLSTRWQRWTGNGSETVGYLGYAMLVLAAVGAWRSRPARAYLVAGLAGALFALGPQIHAGGRISAIPGPYRILALVPGMSLSGVPSRLLCVAYVALCVAGAFGAARLIALASSKGAAARLATFALCAAVPLVEYWPQPYASSQYPVPAPMREWAKDPSRFAVLDTTGEYRMHWHALLHRHPMTGGALSRYPVRLSGWYWSQPVVREIERGPGTWELAQTRTDPAIDFDWGFSSPMPGVGPDDFRVEWKGSLHAPAAGTYRFTLGADDAASIAIDGKPIVSVPGAHPYMELSAQVYLDQGPHPFEAEFEELGGAARVRLDREGPGISGRTTAAEDFRSPAQAPGLEARYYRRSQRFALDREAGREALRSLQVRYVVTGGPNAACEAELDLPRVYAGEGVVVYRVP